MENQFSEAGHGSAPEGSLKRNPANKRYSCEKDGNPLFSPVLKHLRSYQAEVICKECNTHYCMEEEAQIQSF
ncbi:MAG: hypothetical protein LIO46_04780 [Clostridiales bacterium]|nr:hypothetical protein [Clostridiales bacterium]